jgi:hypothetical protein
MTRVQQWRQPWGPQTLNLNRQDIFIIIIIIIIIIIMYLLQVHELNA